MARSSAFVVPGWAWAGSSLVAGAGVSRPARTQFPRPVPGARLDASSGRGARASSHLTHVGRKLAFPAAEELASEARPGPLAAGRVAGVPKMKFPPPL